MKLRMPPGEFWQFLGESIGANPTPVAFAEVYTALQTGAIDGQDNPLVLSRTMKFYEVTTQFVLTGHVVGYDMCAFSAKVWDALKPEQQAKLAAAAEKAFDACDGQVQRAGEGGRRLLQGAGPAGLHARRRGLPRLRPEEVPRTRRWPRTGRRACSSASTRSSDAARVSASAAWLRRQAEHVAVALLLVMFLAFLCQIVFRYLFGWPTGWAFELSIITWVWVVLWGAAFVVARARRDPLRHRLRPVPARRAPRLRGAHRAWS